MKDFWEGQAKKFKYNVQTVNFDPLCEDLEMTFLETLIKDGDVICDVGCGNGRTLIELAKKKKNAKFYGVDFIPQMIDIANEKKNEMNLKNIFFYKSDAATENLAKLFDFKFDKIITKRLLINVKGKSKHQAIKNIHALLKENGTYIMIECFLEPLNKINKIRTELNLEEIKVKTFNEYLPFKFLDDIEDKFVIEKKIDFGSLYYFISRIFNASLSEGDPDYFSPINKLALKLTKMGVSPIEGYSPEIIILLKKIS
ncbi:MAG: class I SAM-dependent methyltransferase [Candidatus Aenigmarchaeota archaeon]|nr:class I SAM-dependent methyltransferase [Candidatus Aenigmarchaeota archaeon]